MTATTSPSLSNSLSKLYQAHSANLNKSDPSVFNTLMIDTVKALLENLGQHISGDGGNVSYVMLDDYSQISALLLAAIKPHVDEIQEGNESLKNLKKDLIETIAALESTASDIQTSQITQSEIDVVTEELRETNKNLETQSSSLQTQKAQLEKSQDQVEKLQLIANNLTKNVDSFKTDVEEIKAHLKGKSESEIFEATNDITDAVEVLGNQLSSIVEITNDSHDLLVKHFDYNENARQAISALSQGTVTELDEALNYSLQIAKLLQNYDNALKKCLNEQDQQQISRDNKV